jgi:hypothetical protein
MAIRKRLAGSILLTGAATALLIGVSAGPALAAVTFTVTPGGAITATAGTTTLTDTKSGVVLMCASSSTAATLKSGSGLSGTHIGNITSVSFSNCTGPFGITFTVASSHLPWHLNAVSFNSSTGVTTGTITGIHAKLSGPGCSATVDGTAATKNNGKVSVTYTNSTGVLKVLPTGGNLHIFNVSGCAGLIGNGDPSAFSGSYTVSPTQTITSP